MTRLLAAGLALSIALIGGAAALTSASREAARPAGSSQWGKLPLVFEPDAGRTRGRAEFLARGPGYRVALGRVETRVLLGGATVSSRLLGARATAIAGTRRTGGVLNSFSGDDPGEWVRGAPLYGAVVQRGVYPGIDLVHRGKQGALEYDFEIAPGADPTRIAFEVAGAHPRLDLGGDLRLETRAGTLVHHRPVAFQRDGDRRIPVDAGFRLLGNRVRFDVGRYDRSRPLVIDPVLSYSTFLGGTASEDGFTVATGADRSAYVGGRTLGSRTFPQGPPSDYAGGGDDGFVMKIAPGGTAVEYLTYYGGNGSDIVNGLDVDADANAYLVGATTSDNLPTADALDASANGGFDGFMAKLGPSGDIVWSTYLGSDAGDKANAVELTFFGDKLFVTGETGPSTDVHFPTVGTSADTTYGGGTSDAFVMTLPADGSTITMSRFVGGNGHDVGNDVTASGEDPIIAGTTQSTDLPVTGTAVQSTRSGSSDMFATLVDGATGGLTYATYAGGGDSDEGRAIVVSRPDPAIDVWLAGFTVGGGVLGATGYHGGSSDGVAIRLDAPGSAQVVYMGGSGNDAIYAGTEDKAGNVIFGGLTQSSPFTVGTTALSTLDPVDSTLGITGFSFTGWLAKLDGTPPHPPLFASYLGGASYDELRSVATDEGTGIYMTGSAASDDFPLARPIQDTIGTGGDAFVSKIGMAPLTLTGPSGAVKATMLQFQASTAEPDATFECNLDPIEPVPLSCGTTKTYPSVPEGDYVFKYRAIDSYGNSDGFVERNVTVDVSPPDDFALLEPADGAKTGTQPSFSWNAAGDSVSKVDEYRLEIDGSEVLTVDSATCPTGTCSATAPGPLATGAHTWRVTAVDAAGNPKPSAQRGFTALSPPSARFAIAPNPALVGNTVTFDGSASADDAHTIARYEWDLDGDGSYEVDGGATSTAGRSYASAQTVNVGLRVTDSTGLTGESRQDLRVNALPPLGSQFGVSINRGAQYTRSANVTVTANFPASTTSLLFSNDGGFFTPQTFTPAREVKWKLDSSGPERLPKTIYVRFLIGNFPSETFQDDIILDERPPVVSQSTLVPQRPGVASASALRRWTLRVRARDSNSGVAGVQITANKRKPGRLLRYRRTMRVRSPVRPRFVRARDKAGNNSRWKRVR